jgi:predicted N-acetyltransferase YhbS
MIVRDEQVADRAAIHDVVKAAFGRQGEADLVDSLREEGSVARLRAASAHPMRDLISWSSR